MSTGPTKPIRLSHHARGHLLRRGFTEEEVVETVRNNTWRPARGGRWQAAQEFPYNTTWIGVHYATKRLRVIFVEGPLEILVVTVYTYFFS